MENYDAAARLASVKEAARLTGLSAHTLRAWERRYGFPNPLRAENGYRGYPIRQIEQLRVVAGFVASGLAPPAAIEELRRERLGNATPSTAVEAQQQERQLAAICESMRNQILRALHQLDEPLTRAVVEVALASVDEEMLIEEIIFPVIRQLADPTKAKNPESAEAFIFSHVAHVALGRALSRYSTNVGPKLWLACPEGELHDVALLACAVLAARRGWSTVFFGQNTPLERLANAAVDLERPSPVAAIVSVTRSIVLRSALPSVRRLADAMPTGVAGPGTVRAYVSGTRAMYLPGTVSSIVARLDPELGAAAIRAASLESSDASSLREPASTR